MPTRKTKKILTEEELYAAADKVINQPLPKIKAEQKKAPTLLTNATRDKLPNLDKINAELCRRNFYEFFQEFFAEFNYQDLQLVKFYEFLCKELQFAGTRVNNGENSLSDIILNVPPGTGKTTILVSFIAWMVANNPKLPVLYASYAHKVATKKLDLVKRVMNSDKYKRYFPGSLLKKDNDDYLELEAGGKIAVASPDAQTMAFHYYLIVCDDIQDAKKAHSRAERENVNRWLSEELSTRKPINKNITLSIFCQQRLRSDDTTAYFLSKQREYNHICLPAQYNEKTVKPESAKRYYTNNLLNPVHLDLQTLENFKINLGLGTFQSQFNQNPEDKSSAIINEDWFPRVTFTNWQLLTEGKQVKYNFYVDGAYTSVTTNDPSAIVATARIVGQEILYIVGVSQVWKDYTALSKHIYQYCTNLGANTHSKIVIEPKGPGLSLIDTLRQDYPINAVAAPSPKGTKKERLSNISGLVMGGKVALLEGDWNQKLIDEITTNDNPRDDIQDAFCMAVNDQLVTGRMNKVPDFRVIDFNSKKAVRF